jgi:hypothetical protein
MQQFPSEKAEPVLDEIRSRLGDIHGFRNLKVRLSLS